MGRGHCCEGLFYGIAGCPCCAGLERGVGPECELSGTNKTLEGYLTLLWSLFILRRGLVPDGPPVVPRLSSSPRSPLALPLPRSLPPLSLLLLGSWFVAGLFRTRRSPLSREVWLPPSTYRRTGVQTHEFPSARCLATSCRMCTPILKTQIGHIKRTNWCIFRGGRNLFSRE
jgi:hypothetical protein